ncbi:uncharacterized protein An02g07150, partial [Aspergillus niger]|uniref:Uncharacterized protein n=2 Tax=Aspergillus niger TaxID=5061 RepID=A0AAJ8BMU1_ASPNG
GFEASASQAFMSSGFTNPSVRVEEGLDASGEEADSEGCRAVALRHEAATTHHTEDSHPNVQDVHTDKAGQLKMPTHKRMEAGHGTMERRWYRKKAENPVRISSGVASGTEWQKTDQQIARRSWEAGNPWKKGPPAMAFEQRARYCRGMGERAYLDLKLRKDSGREGASPSGKVERHTGLGRQEWGRAWSDQRRASRVENQNSARRDKGTRNDSNQPGAAASSKQQEQEHRSVAVGQRVKGQTPPHGSGSAYPQAGSCDLAPAEV